ncbi:STAS domain-containing protein [Streptomyces sp. H27-C3]|uniref:STAS domain-containing protein n=1 Tax=Streptomyces sp. H27-C3 TaxID=3046305 RepID=UPI0024BA1735|nr:STAS domain-containing protein [Streptomyces sp. H27-C3]MDJ0460738.1 STAS domain-containing protein [Streptomyces sp. H27-C3]
MSEPVVHELIRTSVVGGSLVLALAGDLDLHASLRVSPRVSEAVRAAGGPVVIDLREVTFVDCSGLELLLQIRRAVLARGGTVRILSPHPSLLRILRYLILDDPFEIVGQMSGEFSDWP